MNKDLQDPEALERLIRMKLEIAQREREDEIPEWCRILYRELILLVAANEYIWVLFQLQGPGVSRCLNFCTEVGARMVQVAFDFYPPDAAIMCWFPVNYTCKQSIPLTSETHAVDLWKLIFSGRSIQRIPPGLEHLIGPS